MSELIHVYSIRVRDRLAVDGSARLLSPKGYFLFPIISGAGDSIAFWGRAEGEVGYNIWSNSLRGDRLVRLTGDRAITGQPYFSPDARLIYFVSTLGVSDDLEWPMISDFATRSHRNLWVMDADGGNRRRLTTGPYVDERPCVSPDGKTLVFVSNRGGNMNLWSLDLASGAMRQVTHHAQFVWRPVFSPDGRRLAYFTNEGPRGTRELAVMDWPEGKPTFPLSHHNQFNWTHGPFWLGGGSHMIMHCQVTGRTDYGCNLWVFDLAGGTAHPIDINGTNTVSHASMDLAETLLTFDSIQLIPGTSYPVSR